MIERTRGNILEAEAEAIVNTVNCVGVMGRGIAAQFKQAHPDNFRAYAAACERGELVPGRVLVHDRGWFASPRWIINFPTKRHWKGRSRIEDIDAGLVALVEALRERAIRSVAIPALGCGLGGLDWYDVGPRIEAALLALPEVRVLLFEPAGAPPTADLRPLPWTPGRAVLVGLMERYQAGLLEPWISLLELHKLLYFAQLAREPLKLRFVKGPYGPYAENLRHVLSRIEGRLVVGYGDGGDEPSKTIALRDGVAEGARAEIAAHPEVQARFDRVLSLVEGFETPFGLELLATVHWAAGEDAGGDETAVVRAVHGWSERKRRLFEPAQIGLAWRHLVAQGWLPEPPAV
jgi:O-acetyl-ADP-ribose deacetylase (regulator of RNase III)